MKYRESIRKNCIKCNFELDSEVFNYSMDVFNAPLCRTHQDWINRIYTSPETRSLYLALRKRGVPALLEKFDGFKTIDIAVPEARVNIEVDGKHHNSYYLQALADLKRTYYSFQKGYITLRIPNSLIQWNIEKTADYIVDFLNESNYRNWEKW